MARARRSVARLSIFLMKSRDFCSSVISSGVRIGCLASFWYLVLCNVYFFVRPVIVVLRMFLHIAVIFFFQPIQWVAWFVIGCLK